MNGKVRPAKGGGPAAAEARRVRLALVVQYAVSARTLPRRAALRRWAGAALDGAAEAVSAPASPTRR